jgi:hypothetical protein
MQDDNDETAAPVLVCCLSSGTILHISGIPFATLQTKEGGSGGTASAVSGLQVQKFATGFQSPLKWIHLPPHSSSPSSSSSLSHSRVLVIDSEGGLHALQLDRKEKNKDREKDKEGGHNFRSLDIISEVEQEGGAVLGGLRYTDMAVLPLPPPASSMAGSGGNDSGNDSDGGGSDLVLLLCSTSTGKSLLQLLHLDTLRILYSFSSSSFSSFSAGDMDTDSSPLDQFLTMHVLPNPSPQGSGGGGDDTVVLVLVSISHVEEADAPTAVSTFLLTLQSQSQTQCPPPLLGYIQDQDQDPPSASSLAASVMLLCHAPHTLADIAFPLSSSPPPLSAPHSSLLPRASHTTTSSRTVAVAVLMASARAWWRGRAPLSSLLSPVCRLL